MHINEVRNNQFYQFPQWLFNEPYSKLSDKSKLIYMLLWDRRTLSIKNKWYDDEGKVYVYYTNEQLSLKIGGSEKTIIKAKKDLINVGLLKEVRQGVNKPNRLYISGTGDFTGQELEYLQYGTGDFTGQELEYLQGNQTNNIKTNISRLSNQDSSTAIRGENNRQTTLIETDGSQSVGRPIGWSGIQSYLESQNLSLSPKQIGELEDFMELDGLEKSLIEKAIDITAGETGSKRKYNYLKGILTNWKNGNIKTVADHEANEADRKTTNSTAGSGQTYGAKSWWTEMAESGEL